MKVAYEPANELMKYADEHECSFADALYASAYDIIDGMKIVNALACAKDPEVNGRYLLADGSIFDLVKFL